MSIYRFKYIIKVDYIKIYVLLLLILIVSVSILKEIACQVLTPGSMYNLLFIEYNTEKCIME